MQRLGVAIIEREPIAPGGEDGGPLRVDGSEISVGTNRHLHLHLTSIVAVDARPPGSNGLAAGTDDVAPQQCGDGGLALGKGDVEVLRSAGLERYEEHVSDGAVAANGSSSPRHGLGNAQQFVLEKALHAAKDRIRLLAGGGGNFTHALRLAEERR